jgi:transcriptional regulator with XRE-family HTH domain
MATPLEIFGRTVRRLRRQKGWSQEQLAHVSRLHRTYIGGIERGERNVGVLNILQLAQALGVLPTELFREFDEPTMAQLLIPSSD